MKIKFKKLTERAKTPYKKHSVDAGFDFYCTWKDETLDYIEYGTDIVLEIPNGYVGLMFPRSSIRNMHLMLKNSVGVIDASYRGEIKFSFHETIPYSSAYKKQYDVGDRVGQIVFVKIPDVEMIESDKLTKTERGTDGYGSSGK